MHLWLQAIYLICASKEGTSNNQLHSILGVTLKTAWFMPHRIREATRSGSLYPLGSGNGAVEIDDTLIGPEPDRPQGEAGHGYKMKLLSLPDGSTGRTKSVVVKDLIRKTLMPIIPRYVSSET